MSGTKKKHYYTLVNEFCLLLNPVVLNVLFLILKDDNNDLLFVI